MDSSLVFAIASLIGALVLLGFGIRLIVGETYGLGGVLMLVGAFFLLTGFFPALAQDVTTDNSFARGVGWTGMFFAQYAPLIGLILTIFLVAVTVAFFDTRNHVDWQHARFHRVPRAAAVPADHATLGETDAVVVPVVTPPETVRSQWIQGFVALVVTVLIGWYTIMLWSWQPNDSILELVNVAQRHDAFKGTNEFDAFYQPHGRLRAGITLSEEHVADIVDTLKEAIKQKVANLPDTSKWKDLKVDEILGVRYFSRDGKTWTNAMVFYKGELPVTATRLEAKPINKGFVRLVNRQTTGTTTERNEQLIAQLESEIPRDANITKVTAPGRAGSGVIGVDLFPAVEGDFGIVE